jgi:hypothetical protein
VGGCGNTAYLASKPPSMHALVVVDVYSRNQTNMVHDLSVSLSYLATGLSCCYGCLPEYCHRCKCFIADPEGINGADAESQYYSLGLGAVQAGQKGTRPQCRAVYLHTAE